MVRVLNDGVTQPAAAPGGMCTGCMQSCPITQGVSTMFYFLGDVATCPTQIIPSFM